MLPEHVPPRKVIEILATDDDDRSKGNGPPFYFRMDPNADDEIRASFKVEHEPSKCVTQSSWIASIGLIPARILFLSPRLKDVPYIPFFEIWKLL